MKPSLIILTAAALIATAIAATSRVSAAPAASTSAGTQRQAVYGHISSIVRRGSRFEMRFDPAWWLTGLTAERACGCHPVANDYYIVDESHRLLTYAVRADAHVTVLTRHGTGPIPTTSISVAELAQIVSGKNPRHRQLLEPKAGFWLQVGAKYPNPAVSLDQQYQP